MFKHYNEVVSFVRPVLDNRFPIFRDKEVSRTRLLLEKSFGSKIIDGLVLIEMDGQPQQQTKNIRSDITLVIDIKPRISERVSATLGQLNKYQELVQNYTEKNSGSTIHPYRRTVKTIITMDGDDRFDELYWDQEFVLVYFPQNIVHEGLSLLKSKSSFKRRDCYLKPLQG